MLVEHSTITANRRDGVMNQDPTGTSSVLITQDHSTYDSGPVYDQCWFPVGDPTFGAIFNVMGLVWLTAYAIVIVFQLLMNGVLTGLDVVVYDERAIWGPRIAYAPVEDLLFGFAMVTLTLASWAAVNRRANTARRRGVDTDTRPSSTR